MVRGVKEISFRGYMMDIRDASYIVQSILVKANILGYFSFFEKNSPIKRPFKIPKQELVRHGES